MTKLRDKLIKYAPPGGGEGAGACRLLLPLYAMRNKIDILREIESEPDYAGHTVDSVNYRNGCGDTTLHIVSTWGDCEAVKNLLSSGADIYSSGESGYTALHCAVEQNHVEAVLLLLGRGTR